MELRHPLCQITEHFLILMQPLTQHRVVDRLTAGKHKTSVVFRNPHYELGTCLIEVILFHPAEEVGSSHAGKHYPVFDFTAADFPRRE